MSPFTNEPPLDLDDPAVRDALGAALDELDSRLPLRSSSTLPEPRTTRRAELVSLDPATPARVVAAADEASDDLVDLAVRTAAQAYPRWARRPVEERAKALERAAELVRRERQLLTALLVRESGKPWDEADGEVVEAADFLAYYADAAVAFGTEHPLPSDEHESNHTRLVPRGVAAAIAPWNFPFAIPMGMVAGALVGGNSVILKPAEQTPACGAEVIRLLHAAGVPEDVAILLHGTGRVGAALAHHEAVATVAFTGSVQVGVELASVVGSTNPRQRQLKRLVAELGGKNCAIVAGDADLDLTADAIVRSAFSFAGQKCSAVSRVLVEEVAYADLRDRLRERIAALAVGDPDSFDTFVPPVIEKAAAERLHRQRGLASATAEVIAEAGVPSTDGFFVPPTLVEAVPTDSPLLREELFGPILTIVSTPDVEEAARRVDELPVGLTGGIYASAEATIDQIARRSPVGNLYVNRPTVGALVGRQPFGGGRLSGTGHKAGGRDYVAAFCEQQTVCVSRRA